MPPPLASPVSVVGPQLQVALGLLQQAQATGGTVWAGQPSAPLGVLQAVESVPGVIRPEDAAKIRELIQAGNSGEALQRLAAYQDVLQLAQQECAGMPAAATLPLERIAGLFGLVTQDFTPHYFRPVEEIRAASSAPPLAPHAAQKVEFQYGEADRHHYEMKPSEYGRGLILRLGRDGASDVILPDFSVSAKHAEVEFSNGRYWLKDPGSTNGTLLNGVRLSAHERRPLKDGDVLRIGRYETAIRLPYELRLRKLEPALQAAVSYDEVFHVLDGHGFGDIVPAIRDILALRVPVPERLAKLRQAVPYDGGLLVKLEAFLLRGEIVRLRSLYFPTLTPQQALETGTRLAASLAQSRSFADLADRLRRTNAEGFREWIEKIGELQKFSVGYRIEVGFSLEAFPQIFGLREQVARLFFEQLSLNDEQKQDLKWRGVTPDLLLERPWRKFKLSPLLDEALEPFHGAIGERLNWEAMETTLQTAFSDETDSPPEEGSKTRAILYKEYQAKQPVTDSLTGTLGGAVTESRQPGYFDRIAERLGIRGYQGYWLFGGALDSKDVDGRIYLSLRRRHVEAIYRYLSGPLQNAMRAAGTNVQFKIAWNLEAYARSDSGVIYFDAKDQKLVHKLVAQMNREHPEFFKEGHPHFTMPLKDESGRPLQGLSFGEQPAYAHESFGSLRTNQMTTAVRVARALMTTAEPPDWNEVKQICAYFLNRGGVDIENPAFNAGGREKFEGLLGILSRPAAAGEAPKPGVDEQQMKGLIRAEVLARYPGLATPQAANLVLAAVKRMYQQWSDGNRFPGKGPAAASYLPEDIFEDCMAFVLKSVEAKRGHPVIDGFWEALVPGDRGPRALRALEERLAGQCPIFRDPKNGNLLRTIAANVHKAWKGGEQTSERLEALLRERVVATIGLIDKAPASDPFRRRLRAELSVLLESLPRR